MLADLDLDHVERPGADPALACAACGRPIEGAYFGVNGQTVCARCRAVIERLGVQGSSPGAAILRGAVAAALCAAAYTAILVVTGYELGIVAIVVGVVVGKAVRAGAGGRKGPGYRALAVGLTYLAMTATTAFLVVRDRDVPVPVALLVSLATPVFMLRAGSYLGVIILVIGLYEAWKMSAPPRLVVEGPFQAPVHADARPVIP